MRILPVALVEDQPLIKRPAVQQDIACLDADIAHAEVGGSLIHNNAVL